MKSLFDLIESGSLAQIATNKFGLSDSITQMMREQQKWQNQFNSFSMFDSLYKEIGLQQSLYANNLTAIDAITKAIATPINFNIPTTAFDLLNSISRQHEELWGNMTTITKAFEIYNSTSVYVNNLQFALDAISGQMLANAISQKDWSLLDDFKNINAQAIEFTTGITTENALTEEESRRFEKLIETIVSLLKRNKKFGKDALLFLSVIVNLMAIHQYYDFVKDKLAPATREDLKLFERKMFQTIEAQLKQEKEYRTTKKMCNVILKPKKRSLILTTLPIAFDVIVLRNSSKWVYVSYISPTDNLPQTGWVLKKYLRQPK